MPPTLIDTDTISLFLRNQPQVVANFRAYPEVHGRISFSIITYYEIVSGLKHRDARRQLSSSFPNLLPSDQISLICAWFCHKCCIHHRMFVNLPLLEAILRL